LNYRKIEEDIAFRLKLLFLFLSFISFVRLYFNFLPFTPDSIYYLDQYYRIDLFGPGFYERFISFIEILFGNNVKILILINIFIYCFSIKELILMIPNYKNKNLTLFFLFAFFLPSVIWFIPNILRESLFIYFIVMILKHSLIIDNKNTKITFFNFFILFSYSFLSFSLRPQILPILFLWLTFVFMKRKKISLLFSIIIAFLISQSEYIKMQIMRKLSFHYLESFKTEASGNLDKIAFNNLIIPENIFELIYYSPILLIRFLFSPYPWDLSNTKYAFAYLDSIFICFLFFIIFYNLLLKKIDNYKILLFSFLFLFILSIFEISFTGSVRHRLPFIITLLPCLVSKKNKVFKND